MSGACEYKPREKIDSAKEKKGTKHLEILRLVAISIVIVFVGLLQLVQPVWLANIIVFLTVLIGGYPIFKESFYSLAKGRINMELSMVIAIIASLLLQQFVPAIVITFFALMSEFIEEMIVNRGRKSIRSLYELTPRKAIVKNQTDNMQSGTVVDVEDVKIGDIVIIREGDIIPVDGKIVKGISSIDQSSITGESTPSDKNIGDFVFAGTINQTQQLEVRCEKLSSDTTFAKIILLVEEAEVSKANIQKLSDKMATRLIQFAIGLSVLTFLITQNVISSLSVIVVAGACGLAVGTPIAFLATNGKLSRKGILVKGGLQIEKLRNTGTVVFDKTGTLTYGDPIVSQVFSLDSTINPHKVLEYAAIVENNVNHPLAAAIAEKAKQEQIVIKNFSSTVDLPSSEGRGITRIYNGQRISVGNNRYVMKEISFNSSTSNNEKIKLSFDLSGQKFLLKERDSTDMIYSNTGKIQDSTISFVVVDGKVIGGILFEDVLRERAISAVSKLKKMGITVIMLTGDNERIASRVARELGIDQYYSNLLPNEKVSRIENVLEGWKNQAKKHKAVIMVGDGINDAPALAKADVGIAMGKRGTDIAIETADVVLMTDDLLKIPYLVKSSKKAIFTVQQNFFGTLSIDGIGFVLAATGHLNPLIAALIHVVSELVFMVNSAKLVHDFN